jgi:hypothetical protein
MKMYVRFAVLVIGITALACCVSAPRSHPGYLHALSDLRAARWMIEHRPGDWIHTEETEAVRQIDGVINDIRKAAIDDGEDINWHPAVDERPEHLARLHEGIVFLQKAHADVDQEEDNEFAEGLHNRAIHHIDAALQATRQIILSVLIWGS